MDLLTTAEAADYLRLKERKLYELVSEGAIPCSKITGKWLFPRHELDRWVLSSLAVPHGMQAILPPPIVGGSQDQLLEWAMRESGSGLASLPEGSEAGVARLMRGEVLASAIHYHLADQEDANPTSVRRMAALHDGVLVGFARREQGLLLPPGNPRKISTLMDVIDSGARLAVRQPGAGAQMLLDVLLQKAGADLKRLARLDPPCLTGPDLAAAVAAGRADCGLATRSAARTAGLHFEPVAWEHFDLLVRQADYFRPPFQALMHFMRSESFHVRARELSGYDIATAGQIRFAP